MASWLASFFAPEFQGRALQKTGSLAKDQLIQFFQHGKVLFENPDFKMALALGYQKGQNVQDLINQAQAKIWEDKVHPAVQGDFGINSLATVLNKYQNDAEFLRQFYEFVHLEEKALDEAEMPASEFEAKYRQVESIKAAMHAQMEVHKDAMDAMSEEEKQRYMAEMYKAMVDMGLGMSQQQACNRPGACSSHNHGAMTAPVMAPGVVVAAPSQADMPAATAPQAPGGLPALPVRQPAAGGAVMSETEQMAFFQSLQRGSGQQ